MKNLKSFIEYTGYDKLVTEAILDTARSGNARTEVKIDFTRPFAEQRDTVLAGRWQGLSPITIIGLMRFSPNWKETIDLCQLPNIKFTGPNARKTYDTLKAAAGPDTYSFKEVDGGGEKWNLDMQFPGKMQGMFMGNFRKQFPAAKTQFGNGRMTGVFQDEKTAANAFAFARALKNGFIPKKGEAIPWIQSAGEIPEELRQEYEQSVVKAEGGNDLTATLQGSVDMMCKAFTSILAGRVGVDIEQFSPEDIIREFNEKAVIVSNTTDITYDMVWLVDRIGVQNADKNPVKLLETLRQKKIGLAFSKCIDEIETKSETETDTAAAENPNMQQREKNAYYESRFIQNLQQLKLDNIIKQLDEFAKKAEGGQEAFVESKPEPKTPPAVRRMKLFEDAEFYGAEIIRSTNWIAAICRSYDQVHTFGRLKPKVKPGTNEINPACNLRKDEGITPENLKKQQNPDLAWVKDGLGFDKQCYETGQCVTGTFGYWHDANACNWGPGARPVANWTGTCYFNTTKNDELFPMIYWMDCKTGKFVCRSFLYTGGAWRGGDFNTEENSGHKETLFQQMIKDKDFAKIYYESVKRGFKAYKPEKSDPKRKKDISNPPPPNHPLFGGQDETAEQMIKKLPIADNGIITFKSAEEVKANMKTITHPLVTSVKLDFENGAYLFRDKDVSNLKTIDCSRISDGHYMFFNATLNPNLNLVSTANMRDMRYIFANAMNISKITGIDTRSAETMEGFIYGIHTVRERKFVLPELDISKCSDLDQAFADSPVEEIRLKNSDNVETAFSMIQNCWLLKKFPSMNFKRINDLSRLINKKEIYNIKDFRRRAREIFTGCDVLIKKGMELESVIDDLQNRYFTDGKELDTQDFFQLPVLKSKKDVSNYLANMDIYPNYSNGCRLAPPDGNASSWFEDIRADKRLTIPVLDLQGVKNATRLFRNCIVQLGEIYNSDGIEIADGMFADADLGSKTLPEIDLSNCRRMYGIFNSLAFANLRAIKTGDDKYYTKIDPSKLEISDVTGDDEQRKTKVMQYLFGNLYYEQIMNRFQGALDKLIVPIAEHAAENAVRAWKKEHFDERGFLKIFHSDSVGEYNEMARKYGEAAMGKYAGFAIQSETIARGNPLFEDVSIPDGTVVDLDEIDDISNMFSKSVIRGDLKFERCNRVSKANRLFKSAKLHKIPDMSGFSGQLGETIGMFQDAQFENGCGKAIAGLKFEKAVQVEDAFNSARQLEGVEIDPNSIFPHAKYWQRTFACTHVIIKTGETLSLPHAVDTSMTFWECTVDGCRNIDLPLAKSCTGMFFDANMPDEIDEIRIPVAANANGMFESDVATGIKFVGSVYAPTAADAKHMFNGRNIGFVGDVDLPLPQNSIFGGTPLAAVYGRDGEILKQFLDAE